MSLDAGDGFLKQRVMHLPQSAVEGTHNTEEGLTTRLETFRRLNEEDSTILNYFDELEIHPQHISTSSRLSYIVHVYADQISCCTCI